MRYFITLLLCLLAYSFAIAQESQDARRLFDAFKLASASISEVERLSPDQFEAIRRQSQGLLNQIRSERLLGFTGYQPVLTATYALLEWNEAVQLGNLAVLNRAQRSFFDAGSQLCRQADRLEVEFLAAEHGFDGQLIVDYHNRMEGFMRRKLEKEMLARYRAASQGRSISSKEILELYYIGPKPSQDTKLLTGAWLTIKALADGDCEKGLSGLIDLYALCEKAPHNRFSDLLSSVSRPSPPCRVRQAMDYRQSFSQMSIPGQDSLLVIGLKLMVEKCGLSVQEFASRYRNRLIQQTTAAQYSSDTDVELGLPPLRLPLPHPSARELLDRRFFSGATSLGEIGQRLEKALDRCGYHDLSYFGIGEDGFALITRLEQIDAEARPKPEPERWDASMRPNSNFSLISYLKALFYAPEGRFRILVFAATTQNRLTSENSNYNSRDIQGMVSRGSLTLGDRAMLPFTPSHNVMVLVYEFRVRKGQEPNMAQPSKFQGQTHLERARLLQALSE